jgi:vanillate O-demethylase ferredoxin subunit
MTVRVAAKTREAQDIFSFELVDAHGMPLPSFSAGSHIDVEIPGGITRQYSLCNPPSESHRYLIAVLHDEKSRGGSRGMHDLVNVGDQLTISAPKNHFALVHEAKSSLLFAGGIGVTPILCMAERLAAIDAPLKMHYCTRSSERTAFAERIRSSSFCDQVEFHCDSDQKINLANVLASHNDGTHLYVCGPKGFMDAVLTAARAAGWTEDRIHYEFFAAEISASDDDRSFQVKVASTGAVVTVPVEKTVVEALAEIGIEIQTSCEQGICGTCVTRILQGEPDHKDSYLSKDEQAANDQFTPCCSRSRSACLVLDL